MTLCVMTTSGWCPPLSLGSSSVRRLMRSWQIVQSSGSMMRESLTASRRMLPLSLTSQSRFLQTGRLPREHDPDGRQLDERHQALPRQLYLQYELQSSLSFHCPFYPVLGTSWAGLGMTPESHPGLVTRVTRNIVWAH